jgi:DNA topoisomerase-3
MKLEEYSSMLEHGKSEVLDGFVSSKTGNKFSAMITPSADGVKFEFPPREGGPVKGPISPKMTGPGAKGRSSSGSFSGSSSRSSSGVKPKGKKSW